jgi:hypothetical protein
MVHMPLTNLNQSFDCLQEPRTPITPLESGVEMFTKGRPQSLFPIDFNLANGLAVIPELPSPHSLPETDLQPSIATTLTTGLYSTSNTRPLSHITEIDALSEVEYEYEWEEGSEGAESEFVCPPPLILIFANNYAGRGSGESKKPSHSLNMG